MNKELIASCRTTFTLWVNDHEKEFFADKKVKKQILSLPDILLKNISIKQLDKNTTQCLQQLDTIKHISSQARQATATAICSLASSLFPQTAPQPAPIAPPLPPPPPLDLSFLFTRVRYLIDPQTGDPTIVELSKAEHAPAITARIANTPEGHEQKRQLAAASQAWTYAQREKIYATDEQLQAAQAHVEEAKEAYFALCLSFLDDHAIAPFRQQPRARTLQIEGRDTIAVGMSQYDLEEGGLACSFIAAEAVSYMRNHAAEIVEAIQKRDETHLRQIQKTILTAGIQKRKTLLKDNRINAQFRSLVEKEGCDIDDLFKHLPSDLHITSWKGMFGQTEEWHKSIKQVFGHPLRFAIVQTDGQSYAFIGLNERQAILFDPHQREWKIVSCAQAYEKVAHHCQGGEYDEVRVCY